MVSFMALAYFFIPHSQLPPGRPSAAVWLHSPAWVSRSGPRSISLNSGALQKSGKRQTDQGEGKEIPSEQETHTRLYQTSKVLWKISMSQHNSSQNLWWENENYFCLMLFKLYLDNDLWNFELLILNLAAMLIKCDPVTRQDQVFRSNVIMVP